MESKKFFETFPTLKLSKDISGFLAEAMVTSITMNSVRTCVKIYMCFNRLIGREHIAKLEQEIQRQIKPFFGMEVIIYERFNLSELYTPQNIIEEYKESIIFELSKRNKISEQILRESNFKFNGDDKLTIVVVDNFVSKQRTPEIINMITGVFEEKFGLSVEITAEYEERADNRHIREAEYKVDRMIEAISERLKTVEETEKVSEEKAAVEKEEKQPEKEEKKKEQVREFKRPAKRSDNPDVIYGREFTDDTITLDTVVQEMGEITFRGQIMAVDMRTLRNGKIILIFDITDFTDSITVKLFLQEEQYEEIAGDIKKKAFVAVKGVTTIDKFSGELTVGSVSGIMKIQDFRVKRMDMSLEKRVELHCHTKMSDLDGVSDAGEIIEQAIRWGHPAIAITDHGAVQSFTEAYHKIRDLKNTK